MRKITKSKTGFYCLKANVGIRKVAFFGASKDVVLTKYNQYLLRMGRYEPATTSH